MPKYIVDSITGYNKEAFLGFFYNYFFKVQFLNARLYYCDNGRS